MTAHQANELLEYAGANIASTLFLLVTFRWHELIPGPDRLVEWGIGLTVGVSLIALNIIKGVKYYREIKNQRHDRGN